MKNIRLKSILVAMSLFLVSISYGNAQTGGFTCHFDGSGGSQSGSTMLTNPAGNTNTSGSTNGLTFSGNFPGGATQGTGGGKFTLGGLHPGSGATGGGGLAVLGGTSSGGGTTAGAPTLDCDYASIAYEDRPIMYVLVNFHYIADAQGNNFFPGPDMDWVKYNGNDYARQLLEAANDDLSDLADNPLELVPNSGDTRIRYQIYTDPCNESDLHRGVWFHQNGAYQPSPYGDKVLNIKIGPHWNPNNQNSLSGAACSSPGCNELDLYNAYPLNAVPTAGPWNYGRVLNHEFGHVAGLPHVYFCNNPCSDLDIVQECNGPPNYDCSPSWGGGSACFNWGTNSRNIMGNNDQSDALSPCQMETLYDYLAGDVCTFGSALEQTFHFENANGDKVTEINCEEDIFLVGDISLGVESRLLNLRRTLGGPNDPTFTVGVITSTSAPITTINVAEDFNEELEAGWIYSVVVFAENACLDDPVQFECFFEVTGTTYDTNFCSSWIANDVGGYNLLVDADVSPTGVNHNWVVCLSDANGSTSDPCITPPGFDSQCCYGETVVYEDLFEFNEFYYIKHQLFAEPCVPWHETREAFSITQTPGWSCTGKNTPGGSLDTEGITSDMIDMMPNPANNVTRLIVEDDLEMQEISIFDMSGKLHAIQKVSNVQTYNLNVSDLDGGLYMVRIKTNRGMISKKLVIN